MHKIRSMLLAATIAGLPAIATASDLPQPVAAWFDALRANDRDAFQKLLAEDATIELRFIDITQTKAEYLESLDAWEEANADGTEILVRPAGEKDGLAMFEVCYRFPSNESYLSEGFAIAGDMITKNTQEEIGEACEGF